MTEPVVPELLEEELALDELALEEELEELLELDELDDDDELVTSPAPPQPSRSPVHDNAKNH